MGRTVLISTKHMDYIMIHGDNTILKWIPMCEKVNDSMKWNYRITDFRRKTR